MNDVSKYGEHTDERFLTFKSDGHLYAVPAASVSEVVRLPPIARVPQAPRSLMGLANLRGSVFPVASVRALLGGDETATTPASRLIVLDGTSSVALAVDQVSRLVRVAREKIRTAEADVASKTGERLTGVFESHSEVVKILDIPELLRQAFVAGVSRRKTADGTAISKAPASVQTDVRRQRLVTFEVAGQEYALPLDTIREIVATPDHLTTVPGSDEAVRGVMPYRDGLLPLLSLQRLLGLPSTPAPREQALIVSVGNTLIGFVADRMRTVISVEAERVEKVPPVLAARVGGETKVKEVYRAANDRLISVLAPERLLREDVMQRLIQRDVAMKPATAERSLQSEAVEMRFLVFRLDNDEFALPIKAVDEVARVPEQITRLPKTPKFLEGVINLRGEVLPVIDQRRRFEMPSSGTLAGKRLVVVRTDRHRAGLIVDSVSEVLRCASDSIKPSPDLTGDAHGLVRSVINLEASARIVLLLDPSELLTRAELGLLESFGKDMHNKDGAKGSRQTKQ
ncbi:chemotaxis protein CheW [Bradyrhizobium sp. SSBR45G]|uniref:chemotaxis protein CheW n=1 Tax=unclassified Bradyrhizobium TaxID=2631580 RepID=UPI002342A861|nr:MULTISPECIES: chemotaxis protein CheW [unclassified Bradyrhizobium]GLH76681.1 chemotaxis protein CheW [Bradyrhizobium sp. SSBR45G]GLH84294.1 chemotaxis protein CheW [Bradyrhizobium sp. SSBR45R]